MNLEIQSNILSHDHCRTGMLLYRQMKKDGTFFRTLNIGEIRMLATPKGQYRLLMVWNKDADGWLPLLIGDHGIRRWIAPPDTGIHPMMAILLGKHKNNSMEQDPNAWEKLRKIIVKAEQKDETIILTIK